MPLLSSGNAIKLGTTDVTGIYLGTQKIWTKPAQPLTVGSVSTNVATETAVKKLSVNLPADTPVGSHLFLCCSTTTSQIANYNLATVSPGTWTKQTYVPGSSGLGLYMFHKTAVAGDAGRLVTLDFTDASTTYCSIILGVIWVSQAAYFNSSTNYFAGGSYGRASAISACPANSQIVIMSNGVGGTSSVGTTYTAPTGWTVLGAANTNALTSARQYLMVAKKDAKVTGDFAGELSSPGFDDGATGGWNRGTIAVAEMPV